MYFCYLLHTQSESESASESESGLRNPGARANLCRRSRDAHSFSPTSASRHAFLAVNALALRLKKKAMLTCLEWDDPLLDVSKDVGVEGDVVFEDV